MAAIYWHQSLKDAREAAQQFQKPILIDIYDPG